MGDRIDGGPEGDRPILEKLLCFNPLGATYDDMPESIPHIGPSRNMIPRPKPLIEQ